MYVCAKHEVMKQSMNAKVRSTFHSHSHLFPRRSGFMEILQWTDKSTVEKMSRATATQCTYVCTWSKGLSFSVSKRPSWSISFRNLVGVGVWSARNVGTTKFTTQTDFTHTELTQCVHCHCHVTNRCGNNTGTKLFHAQHRQWCFIAYTQCHIHTYLTMYQ